jgi:hypothetical protein
VADRSELVWKLLATAAAVGAGIAARNVATAGWKRTVGGEPPTNPADPATSWQEALGWSILTGVLVGTARLFARRSAAGLWRRRRGDLPPGLQEVS